MAARFAISSAAILALAGGAPAQDVPATAEDPRALFEERILPILRSPDPSSCTECHLGGLDLKDYLFPDPRETFAALRDAGLADLKNPDASGLLDLIRMKPDRPSPEMERARQVELDAFRSWLRAAAGDPSFAEAPPAERPAGPSVPAEVIRHARKDRLLASFVENVWSERMRCWGCHAPGDPPLPKQLERKRQWILEHGEEVLLWFASEDPEASMDHILRSRIVDLKDPARSLLLTKATEQVKHAGGKKMSIGDRAYRQFLRFLEDYARIRSNAYRSEEELPGIIATPQWLRVRGIPSRRVVLMQVDLHRRDGGGWSEAPLGSALSEVLQGVWHAPIEITAPRPSPDFSRLSADRRLPPGRYLLRFYLDRMNRLQRDPSYRFGPEDLTAEAEIDASNWPADERGSALPKDRIAKVVEFPR